MCRMSQSSFDGGIVTEDVCYTQELYLPLFPMYQFLGEDKPSLLTKWNGVGLCESPAFPDDN